MYFLYNIFHHFLQICFVTDSPLIYSSWVIDASLVKIARFYEFLFTLGWR